jgi:amino acid adenylation domain-containing protein
VLAGLFLSNPSDTAVAMLGAWRAGFGILPLPPDYPDARLLLMIEDGRPRLVITDAALSERAAGLCGPAGVDVVRLAEMATPASAAGPAWPTPPPPRPRSMAAYRLYTSGSAGPPKAVVIRLEQLYPLLAWSMEHLGAGPRTRMAQTLSLGFDFGLQELFTTFALGGCLVVPDAASRRNGATYAEFLARERINTFFTTPSFADIVAGAGRELPDLECVLIGGEVLRRDTVAGLRRLVPGDCRIFNGYGPTEAAVNCLMHRVTGQPAGPGEILPVGRASGASLVSVVDRHQRPVPARVIGELVIGGPGVADRCADRTGRYAHAFAAHARPAAAGRCYPSGDLAYYDRGEGFTVIGRTDSQRKIRGFRMDLGEVRAAIADMLPAHRVLVRALGSPSQLAAFVCGGATDLNHLQAQLKSRFPPPMVPHRFFLLDSLPMTGNGKLDEAALASIFDSDPVLEFEYSTAPGQVADLICRAWSVVLDARPDPAENVFDAGAHSLAAATVHAQLCAALRLDFPMFYLFEYPRPVELARVLARLMS